MFYFGVNYIQLCLVHNSIVAEQRNQRQVHETFLQFELLGSWPPPGDRLAMIDDLVYGDLYDFFTHCDTVLRHLRTFFPDNGAKLVQLLVAQLDTCIVPTLVYRLKSIERVDDDTMDLHRVFYSVEFFFRTVNSFLCKCRHKLPDRVVLALRQLIGSINQQLLVDCLPRQLNRLSEQLFLVNAEQDHEDERLDESMLLRPANDNHMDILRALNFKTNMCNLLDAVGEFELELRTANQYFKEHNDIYLVDPSAHTRIGMQALIKIGYRMPHSTEFNSLSPTTLATKAAAAESSASALRPSVTISGRMPNVTRSVN